MGNVYLVNLPTFHIWFPLSPEFYTRWLIPIMEANKIFHAYLYTYWLHYPTLWTLFYLMAIFEQWVHYNSPCNECYEMSSGFSPQAFEWHSKCHSNSKYLFLVITLSTEVRVDTRNRSLFSRNFILLKRNSELKVRRWYVSLKTTEEWIQKMWHLHNGILLTY